MKGLVPRESQRDFSITISYVLSMYYFLHIIYLFPIVIYALFLHKALS